jgi:hypothetical protein
MANKKLPRKNTNPEDTAKGRLKVALQSNLAKRKAQQRARSEIEAEDGPVPDKSGDGEG